MGLGDVRKLGKPGGAAILYYLTTTVLAVVVGLVVVNVIRPGRNLTKETVQQGQEQGDEQVARAQRAEGKKVTQVTWNTRAVSERSQERKLATRYRSIPRAKSRHSSSSPIKQLGNRGATRAVLRSSGVESAEVGEKGKNVSKAERAIHRREKG